MRASCCASGPLGRGRCANTTLVRVPGSHGAGMAQQAALLYDMVTIKQGRARSARLVAMLCDRMVAQQHRSAAPVLPAVCAGMGSTNLRHSNPSTSVHDCNSLLACDTLASAVRTCSLWPSLWWTFPSCPRRRLLVLATAQMNKAASTSSSSSSSSSKGHSNGTDGTNTTK